jgi:hypothetical protein
MVSISPRSSTLPGTLSALRAEQELAAWDGDEPPSTLRSDGSDRLLRVGAFLDELASDGLELGLRLLVVDSIAMLLPVVAANEPFFVNAGSVVALREALDMVCTRAGDPRVSRVIGPDTPLGAYVKGLYIRASAVARALELSGFRTLDDRAKAGGDEPGDNWTVARTLAESEGFHFPDLRDSIRRDLANLRLELGQTSIVRVLRDAVERLFVASDRLGRGGAA